MHARHYSPSLGRLLQPDPSRQDAQLFVYTGNGQVTKTDPSGLLVCPVCVAVAMLAVRVPSLVEAEAPLRRLGACVLFAHEGDSVERRIG